MTKDIWENQTFSNQQQPQSDQNGNVQTELGINTATPTSASPHGPVRSGLRLEGFSTIGQMAREFDVSLRALRFYEDRGLLNPFRQGRRRFYDQTQARRLQMILKGKRLGFTLTEIHQTLQGIESFEAANFEMVLEPGQVLAQISELERQRNALDSAIAELKQAQQSFTGPSQEPSVQGPSNHVRSVSAA